MCRSGPVAGRGCAGSARRLADGVLIAGPVAAVRDGTPGSPALLLALILGPAIAAATRITRPE